MTWLYQTGNTHNWLLYSLVILQSGVRGKPIAMAMVTMNSVNKTKSGTLCSHVNFHVPITFSNVVM